MIYIHYRRLKQKENSYEIQKSKGRKIKKITQITTTEITISYIS